MSEKCKRCGASFEIPDNAIDMAFAYYCRPCIRAGLKRYASLSPYEVITHHAKQVF